jgi:hypothetical protein
MGFGDVVGDVVGVGQLDEDGEGEARGALGDAALFVRWPGKSA